IPELKSALRSMIDAGISAAGCNGEPAQVMRPAPIMACALRLVGKAAMGHAQQRAAVALDQIDLDQARSRRHLFATLPAEGVDETVDRHDLSKRATRNPGVAADAFEEVKSARMCFGRRLAAHPADDLFRVGQEGENRGGRGGDLGLASHEERFIHRCLLGRAGTTSPAGAHNGCWTWRFRGAPIAVYIVLAAATS